MKSKALRPQFDKEGRNDAPHARNSGLGIRTSAEEGHTSLYVTGSDTPRFLSNAVTGRVTAAMTEGRKQGLAGMRLLDFVGRMARVSCETVEQVAGEQAFAA